MEMKTLRSFIAVAEMKNFSAAARVLNTVQPAISRQISDLEEELGVRLFWRNTREVKITAAGQSLLKDAYEILDRETKAKDQARRAGHGEVGRLRIGYLGPACLSFIPMLVQQYTNRYPEVQVTLNEMTVRQQIDAFRGGRIDIGLSRPLVKVKGMKINSVELYIDSLMAVLPDTHPLCAAKRIRLAQIKDESFVLFNRNEASGLFNQILMACHEEDFVPGIRSQPKTMQTVVTEVAAGLGVSVVPGCIQRLYSKGCVFIPIQKQKPTIPLELHYMADEPTPTVDAFVEMATQAKKDIQRLVFSPEIETDQ